MSYLKKIVLAIFTVFVLSGTMYALNISSSIDNAIQYIKYVFITDDGTSAGNTWVVLDWVNSEVWSTKYCDINGQNCIIPNTGGVLNMEKDPVWNAVSGDYYTQTEIDNMSFVTWWQLGNYLTEEIDWDVTNELQTLSKVWDTISLSSWWNFSLSEYAKTVNHYTRTETDNLLSNYVTTTGVYDVLSGSYYTQTQIDNMSFITWWQLGNYLTEEIDWDVTNELQTLSKVWDTISLSSWWNFSLSEYAKVINHYTRTETDNLLSNYITMTGVYDVLSGDYYTQTEIDNMNFITWWQLGNYLTEEIDWDVTNELQTLSFDNSTKNLTISSGNVVNLSWLVWTDTGGAAVWNDWEIQFNNSWNLGSNSMFVRDSVNNRLWIGTDTPNHSLDVVGDLWIWGEIYDSDWNSWLSGQILVSNWVWKNVWTDLSSIAWVGSVWWWGSWIYSSLYSTQTQTFSVNTPSVITLNSEYAKNWITNTNGVITVQTGWLYNLTLEAQLYRTTWWWWNSATSALIWMQIDTGAWFVDVPWSAINNIWLEAGNTIVAPLTTLIDLNPWDRIQYMIEVDSTSLTLYAEDPVSWGHPWVPSVIFNMNRI